MELLYFAWVREKIGTGQEQLDPPEAIRNVADLIYWLAGRSPGHAEALCDPTRLRAAIAPWLGVLGFIVMLAALAITVWTGAEYVIEAMKLRARGIKAQQQKIQEGAP